MRINIRSSRQEHNIDGIEVPDDASVHTLLHRIADAIGLGNQLGAIRLIHRGQLVRDPGTLAQYHIEDGSIVHMVVNTVPNNNNNDGSGGNSNTTSNQPQQPQVHTMQIPVGSGVLSGTIQSILNMINSPQQQQSERNISITVHTGEDNAVPDIANSIASAVQTAIQQGIPMAQAAAAAASAAVQQQQQQQQQQPVMGFPVHPPRTSSSIPPSRPTRVPTTVVPPAAASGAVPVTGLTLHVHCSLDELSAVPERIETLLQRYPNLRIEIEASSRQTRGDDDDDDDDQAPLLIDFITDGITFNIDIQQCMALLGGDWSLLARYREQIYTLMDVYERQHVRAGMTDAQLARREGDKLYDGVLRDEQLRTKINEKLVPSSPFYSEMKCHVGHAMKDSIALLRRDASMDDDAWVNKMRRMVVRHSGMEVSRCPAWFVDGCASLSSIIVSALSSQLASSGNDSMARLLIQMMPMLLVPTLQRWQQTYETELRTDTDEQCFTVAVDAMDGDAAAAPSGSAGNQINNTGGGDGDGDGDDDDDLDSLAEELMVVSRSERVLGELREALGGSTGPAWAQELLANAAAVHAAADERGTAADTAGVSPSPLWADIRDALLPHE